MSTYINDELDIIERHAGGQFLQVNMDHMKYLEGDQLVINVLAYVLNLLRMKINNETDKALLIKNDNWFVCPAALIQEKLCIGKDSQIRAVKRLEEKELLHLSKRRGNVLWVKVNTATLQKIQQIIRVLDSRSQSSGKPKSRVLESRSPIYTKNLSKNLTESSRSTPLGVSDSPPPFFPETKEGKVNCPSAFHAQLANTIFSKVESKLQKRIKLSSWQTDLVLLEQYIVKSTGLPLDKARKVMKKEIEYHLLHLDCDRQPEALAPSGMLKKWRCIVKANKINRQQEGEDDSDTTGDDGPHYHIIVEKEDGTIEEKFI